MQIWLSEYSEKRFIYCIESWYSYSTLISKEFNDIFFLIYMFDKAPGINSDIFITCLEKWEAFPPSEQK